MKKFVLLLLISVTLLLTGCDPGLVYFSGTTSDEIERIELVKYNNDSYKMIDVSKETPKFDSDKIEVIETLEKEKINDFLCDFEKIIFHDENDSVNEPTGYCLLWYLKDGNFIVFSSTIEGDRAYSMVSEFDSTDNFVRHSASFASKPHYDDVLKKYFKSYSE